MKICIDPGHGGSDPGAVGSGLREKDLTLDIAVKTRDALRPYAADVYLTRDTDVDLELADRAAIANRLGADYFCSIHVNAGGGTGFESYVYAEASEDSRALRSKIHSRLSQFYKAWGFADRGQKSANFAVLRLTAMPAVLLENLFIDRNLDVTNLAEPTFRMAIAEAIALGLVDALELRPNVPIDSGAEGVKRMSPEDVNKIIAFLQAAWRATEDPEARAEFNRLANELRKVSGQPEE